MSIDVTPQGKRDQKRIVVEPRISLPSFQWVAMKRPFLDGLIFGMGFICAQAVLMLIALMVWLFVVVVVLSAFGG